MNNQKDKQDDELLNPTTPSKYQYRMDFPRASNYSSMNELVKAFPHLKYVNSNTFDSERVNNADFFVIKSTNDDDVHKAIKYGVWTSSTLNNITFSQSFKDKKQVFLLFSVVRSDQFLGVAKMTSEFSKNDSFKYWWEGCKWFGIFKIEWVFVKDIKQKYFQNLDLEIETLKDGTYLELNEGKTILQVFQDYQGKNNIFSAFEFMDEREDELRYNRENDENFKMQFDELSKNYSRNPHNIIPRKKYKDYKNPYYQYRGYPYKQQYNPQYNPQYNQPYQPYYHQYPANYNYNYPYNAPFHPTNEPFNKEASFQSEQLKPKYNSHAEPFIYKENPEINEQEEKKT